MVTPGQRNDGYPPVLPTATFELLSPSNVTATGYGKLVVMLDPKKEHAVIRRSGNEDETVTERILTFSDLPALELDAEAIYEDCNRS